MTTTVSQEAVEVTQADREAAQAVLDTWFNRSMIETILARHRQSAERGEAWRPIETAPKDGTRFWGFWPVDDEVGQQQVTYFDQFTLPFPRFCELADHIDWTQPTHWQPLPTPPEDAPITPIEGNPHEQ